MNLRIAAQNVLVAYRIFLNGSDQATLSSAVTALQSALNNREPDALDPEDDPASYTPKSCPPEFQAADLARARQAPAGGLPAGRGTRDPWQPIGGFGDSTVPPAPENWPPRRSPAPEPVDDKDFAGYDMGDPPGHGYWETGDY